MDSGLGAGSHQRNELHILLGHEEVGGQDVKENAVKICKVCSDEIEVKENGEVFVACYECGFPVCRPCYIYERSQGNQSCPQCNTRYKRHKGCPREGGDEDDAGDLEDLEDEFQIKNPKPTLDRPQVDLNSENGEQTQQWKPNGVAFSSFTRSVVGKEFEGEKEMENNLEWKDRVDKWKARQEKKGLINRNDDDDQELEDYEL